MSYRRNTSNQNRQELGFRRKLKTDKENTVDSGQNTFMKLAFTFAVTLLAVAGAIFCYQVFKEGDALKNNEKAVVGTLKELNITNSFWEGDITTITLNDGRVVALSGRINPWKPGDPVLRYVADPASKVSTSKYWCVSDQCLKQE